MVDSTCYMGFVGRSYLKLAWEGEIRANLPAKRADTDLPVSAPGRSRHGVSAQPCSRRLRTDRSLQQEHRPGAADGDAGAGPHPARPARSRHRRRPQYRGFCLGLSRLAAGRRRCGIVGKQGAAGSSAGSNSCRRSTKTSRQPPCSAPSRSKPTPGARSRACSASGTARAPASIAPAMRSSTATPMVPRRMAGFWSWPATIMVACRPRCRINPMSRSWPGSCRR